MWGGGDNSKQIETSGRSEGTQMPTIPDLVDREGTGVSSRDCAIEPEVVFLPTMLTPLDAAMIRRHCAGSVPVGRRLKQLGDTGCTDT